MLQDSKAPYFEKSITDVMLRRSESVKIPKEFTRTYDDIFNTPELFLTGPSGHSRPVMLKVRSYDRVFLNRGWVEFVKENGFQVGDHILFWMVKKATFRVFLYSQPEKKAISTKDEEESGRDNNTTLFGISSKDEKDCVLGHNGAIENVKFSEPLYSKVYHRHVKQETVVPKCETNLNPAETPSQQRHCGSPGIAEVVAVKKRCSILGEKELVKHPGLASACSFGPGFPHFVRKLAKISTLDSKDIHLELPFPFVQEHGHKFQARVFLLGPSGCSRLVSLRVLANGRRNRSRVQIRKGWKSFVLENGFKMGDQLLFTLVGFSKFVVQLSPFV
ncbi:hypothetical protein KC19_2G205500 [Ceratodon purpureus]|uniref:TF-B3 domain-containing protein n=1 Tax=Ceratodon purpureus TaxID=3225 RepID=A0A8T0IXP6_CERPU|nr:hypothetical protein KC19_2G205500 [Ceratodon purpureus]